MAKPYICYNSYHNALFISKNKLARRVSIYGIHISTLAGFFALIKAPALAQTPLFAHISTINSSDKLY